MPDYRRIAFLTDDEAATCLNIILKGWVESTRGYDELVGDQQALSDLFQRILAQVDEPKTQLQVVKPEKEAKAIRGILIEISDNEELAPRLDSWFRDGRPKLIEPITSALALAGIIVVLSTGVNIKYKGKKLNVKIERKASTQKLLEKFMDFFS